MMQKNEIVKVKIEDIGVGGEGIGKVDGYTLFIKDAIIGEVVEAKVMKAKKNYGYARLMNVLTPSKDRVAIALRNFDPQAMKLVTAVLFLIVLIISMERKKKVNTNA